VDIRKSSPYFGRWVGVELSEENRRQMWIPVGFAHAFLGLSDFAEFLYKTTDYWAPQYERTIIWNDPSIGIKWPLSDLKGATPKLSAKDNAGLLLSEAEVYS
jgi:dTDP-4-dehydrorhamnose 3,5-epimerase